MPSKTHLLFNVAYIYTNQTQEKIQPA